MGASVRTCVGCRERAERTALVRLVVAGEGATQVVTPDVDGTLPGRGANLHPTSRCLDLARRRKAFGRALRVEGPLDTSQLDAIVAGPA